jgi:hypothetical protein
VNYESIPGQSWEARDMSDAVFVPLTVNPDSLAPGADRLFAQLELFRPHVAGMTRLSGVTQDLDAALITGVLAWN